MIRMPAMTPSQLLEIRRVKAMIAGAGTTMDPQCFLGPPGPTGATGPAGATGNYGIPASVGYYNTIAQDILTVTPTVVIWNTKDEIFSQGVTGIEYSNGKFMNYSNTDGILANVSGFISFGPNITGVRSVYAEHSLNKNRYGYTQIATANSVDALGQRFASSSTIIPFSFNIYLAPVSNTISSFEIYVYHDSINAAGGASALAINVLGSRISITRINTTMKGPTGPTGPSGGPKGDTGARGEQGSALLGKIIRIDSVNGDDNEGSPDGRAYATFQRAIAEIGTSQGYTIWVLPGTYILQAGITIPPGNSIRGMSAQTTILELNAQEDTTLLTMGENTTVEDLTLRLTSAIHRNLKGIVFGGTTSATAKIHNCVLTVNNSAASSTGTSIVIGVEARGTQVQTRGTTIRGCTINVYSNGGGNKRGILVNESTVISTRDVNIFVDKPVNTTSTGSYVGVETTTGSIQLKSTTVETVTPGGQYTASDILQTRIETNSLSSTGIQIGPGTDLVTKTAGGKPFSTYNYSNIIFYGVNGNIRNLTSEYLWPGTQSVSTVFPDPSPIPYYIQKPCILAGMSCSLIIPPGLGNTLAITVWYTPNNGTMISTNFQVIFGSTDTLKNFYTESLNLRTGDSIYVRLTGSTSTNNATDLTVQLNIF